MATRIARWGPGPVVGAILSNRPLHVTALMIVLSTGHMAMDKNTSVLLGKLDSY